MNDETGNEIPSGKVRSGKVPSRQPDERDGGRTLSNRELLFVLMLVGLAVVGGYFFILKMIDVSRQEDCFLAQRRNCTPSQPFRQ